MVQAYCRFGSNLPRLVDTLKRVSSPTDTDGTNHLPDVMHPLHETPLTWVLLEALGLECSDFEYAAFVIYSRKKSPKLSQSCWRRKGFCP